MEAPPRGGGAPLGRVRSGRSGPICVAGNDTLSTLVLPHASSSAWAGCHGAEAAEASSVCISPDRSASGSYGESMPGWGPSISSSHVLASPSVVLGPCVPPRRFSPGDSDQEGPPLSGGGHHLSPPPRVMEVVGVAPEGAQLIASGLSRLLRPYSSPELPPRGNCMPWSGNFHFLVRTATARPSQLPGWFSSGVSAGAILRRVIPLHSKGLRGSHSCLPCPSGWSVSGKTPVSYTFPPWHPEAEAEASTAHQGALMGPGSGSGGSVQCSLWTHRRYLRQAPHA